MIVLAFAAFTFHLTIVSNTGVTAWKGIRPTMFSTVCVITLLILLAGESYSFTLLGHRALTTNSRTRSAFFAVPEENSANADKDSVAASEMKQVNKGLTHIKYNKYAPTAEEAKDMTDEQFRKVIFTRMVSPLFLLSCKCIQFSKENAS